MILTDFQKGLLNILQSGLPVCQRPYAAIARELAVDEERVLNEVAGLREAGVIRRIRAVIDYRALGFAGTLATVHVPEYKLDTVAGAVNALEGVSHNYLRKHYYNMWFTLQERSEEAIDARLAGLSERLGIAFHSLPVVRYFKLDVRFDAADGQRILLGNAKPSAAADVVELTDIEKQFLPLLQREVPVVSEPFDAMAGEPFSSDRILMLLEGLLEKGVIRRIAGVVNHRKLGFAANAMFVADVPERAIVEAGRKLASTGVVSHCYERRTFSGWPYNLFGMMHGRTMDQIHGQVRAFIEENSVADYDLLSTAAELKKKPVKYDLA